MMFARILQIFVVKYHLSLRPLSNIIYLLYVEREGQAIPDLSYIVYGACKWKLILLISRRKSKFLLWLLLKFKPSESFMYSLHLL